MRHTWKEAVVEWSKDAVGQVKPSTLKRYFVSLGQLRDILDGLYIDEISRQTISRMPDPLGDQTHRASI